MHSLPDLSTDCLLWGRGSSHLCSTRLCSPWVPLQSEGGCQSLQMASTRIKIPAPLHTACSGSPLCTLSWPISLSVCFTKIPKSKKLDLILTIGPFSPLHVKVSGISECMLTIYSFHAFLHIFKKKGGKKSFIQSVCSYYLPPYLLLGTMLLGMT